MEQRIFDPASEPAPVESGGEVPERPNGLVSKTSVSNRAPGVRIPPSPPTTRGPVPVAKERGPDHPSRPRAHGPTGASRGPSCPAPGPRGPRRPGAPGLRHRRLRVVARAGPEAEARVPIPAPRGAAHRCEQELPGRRRFDHRGWALRPGCGELVRCGEVSERLKEHAWKACMSVSPASWVRIPPSPPFHPPVFPSAGVLPPVLQPAAGALPQRTKPTPPQPGSPARPAPRAPPLWGDLSARPPRRGRACPSGPHRRRAPALRPGRRGALDCGEGGHAPGGTGLSKRQPPGAPPRPCRRGLRLGAGLPYGEGLGEGLGAALGAALRPGPDFWFVPAWPEVPPALPWSSLRTPCASRIQPARSRARGQPPHGRGGRQRAGPRVRRGAGENSVAPRSRVPARIPRGRPSGGSGDCDGDRSNRVRPGTEQP